MAKILDRPLYLITDGGKARSSGSLLEIVEQALEGAQGLFGFVQLREQVANSDFAKASDKEIKQLAEELCPLCHQHGAKLIISRKADIAAAAGADGVHLGMDSSLETARISLTLDSVVGYSAHLVDEAKAALESGFHYTFLSPIFPPLSKQDTRHPLGLAALKAVSDAATGTVFALGGITAQNAHLCRDTGVSGIAVIGAIFEANNAKVASQALAEAWTGGEAPCLPDT